jgi:hypothetical protein
MFKQRKSIMLITNRASFKNGVSYTNSAENIGFSGAKVIAGDPFKTGDYGQFNVRIRC